MSTRENFESWARENMPGVKVSRLKYGEDYEELALEIRWQGYLLGRRVALEEAVKLCEDGWHLLSHRECAGAIRELATKGAEG